MPSVKGNPNGALPSKNRTRSRPSQSKIATIRQVGIAGENGGQGEQGIQGDMGAIGPIGPPGVRWRGAYVNSNMYELNDSVEYLGSTYIYTNATPDANNVPNDVQYWDLMTKGNPAGEDKHYVHIQNVASALWEITHNLGTFPSVTVIDSGNSEVEGAITYIGPNVINVEFSAPFGGKAYLN